MSVTQDRDPERYAPKEPMRHRLDFSRHGLEVSRAKGLAHNLDFIAFGVEAISRAGAFGRPFAADLQRLVELEAFRLDENGDPRRPDAPGVLKPCPEARQLAARLRKAMLKGRPKRGRNFKRLDDLLDGLLWIVSAEESFADPSTDYLTAKTVARPAPAPALPVAPPPAPKEEPKNESPAIARLHAMWAAAEEEADAQQRGDHVAAKAAARKLQALAIEEANEHAQQQVDMARSHGQLRALLQHAQSMMARTSDKPAPAPKPAPQPVVSRPAPVPPPVPAPIAEGSNVYALTGRMPRPRVRPETDQQPTLAALRAMEPEARRDALKGRESRAASRRRARHAHAVGFRLLLAH